MAARVTEAAPNAGDDLDNLLGYDLDENILGALDAANSQQQDANGGQGTGLGLDQEVKIAKKRAPIAKLDEGRLLSQAGIPKLRTLVKDRLVLKGKGHEFDDVSRILEMYQLWMDDLYPRAKMADGLAIIEKLGHNKKMQMLRRHWIDEGKPRDTSGIFPEVTDADQAGEKDPVDGEDRIGHDESAAAAELIADESSDDDGLFVRDTSKPTDDVPMDDLDELLAVGASNAAATRARKSVEPDDQPMHDDLDALLDEEETHSARQPGAQAKNTSSISLAQDEDFADDMEAMGDMW